MDRRPEWLEVSPEKEWPYTDDKGNPFRRLDGLGKVNIFVGPNNGGKSRLLRSLARQQSFAFGIARKELQKLSHWLTEQHHTLDLLWRSHGGLQNIGVLHHNALRNAAVPETLDSQGESLKSLRSLATALRGATPNMNTGGAVGHRQPSPQLLSQLQALGGDLEGKLDEIAAFDLGALSPKQKFYIPVLRGLRNLGGTNQDIYAQRINTEYFNAERAPGAPHVFSGLSLYERVKTQLLGPRDGRKQIRDYERFLAKHIFDVRDVQLIPRLDFDVLCVKIGDEPERAVHELGDGIQSVIILTFLLINTEHTWLFIEEPELFLHPGLQRKVLALLLQNANGHRSFLTTHSNHFLDMSLDYTDVAIYGIYKSHVPGKDDEQEPQFRVEVLDAADQNALSLLGVRNSSVFLVNATIWVEGVTDRFYLRALLELYQQRLSKSAWRAEEDVHFSFVEYGGGNVVHFAFGSRHDDDPRMRVDRICARALVIADDDGGKKRKRLDEMRTVLGDRLLVLPVREIENLLPWNVLKSVIAEYEQRDPTTLSEPDEHDRMTMPLGTLIEGTVLGNSRKRKGSYCAESGTLNAKPDFCQRALEYLKDPGLLDELPPKGKELLESIYNFVKRQNADAVEAHGSGVH